MADEQLDWNTIANTKLGDVEAPPVKPLGHYVATISARGEVGNSSKKQTPFVEFPIQVTEALADVDAEQLEASGGLPVQGKVTFWLSAKALWMYTDFAKAMGVSDDAGITESFETLAASGEAFVVECRHEPNQNNPDRPFTKWENPIPMSVWQARS